MPEQWAVRLVWQCPEPKRLIGPPPTPTPQLRHPPTATPLDETRRHPRKQSLRAVSPVPTSGLTRYGYPVVRLLIAHREHQSGRVAWRLTNQCAFGLFLCDGCLECAVANLAGNHRTTIKGRCYASPPGQRVGRNRSTEQAFRQTGSEKTTFQPRRVRKSQNRNKRRDMQRPCRSLSDSGLLGR